MLKNIKRLLAAALALMLCACSQADMQIPILSITGKPVMETPMPIPTDVLRTEAPTEAPTAEPTPEPTEAPTPEPTAEPTPEITAAPLPTDPEDWMNILLLGCDSYGENTYDRTDSMIILSVNPVSNEVKLTSLMRDTWITVPGTKSRHRKLTELCTVGGPAMTIQAINDNFGMDIEKYVLISMAGIADVIDILGGLDLDVTEAERKALNKGLFDLSSRSGMEKLEESGEGVHLNGNQATAYARIRKIDSDYVRTERQRTVLLAMAQKLKDGASGPTLLAIVSSLMPYVETNLSLPELLTLASAGLNMDLSAARELRIPADGTFESGTYDGIWCIKPNFEKNEQILHEFIYGQ